MVCLVMLLYNDRGCTLRSALLVPRGYELLGSYRQMLFLCIDYLFCMIAFHLSAAQCVSCWLLLPQMQHTIFLVCGQQSQSCQAELLSPQVARGGGSQLQHHRAAGQHCSVKQQACRAEGMLL